MVKKNRNGQRTFLIALIAISMPGALPSSAQPHDSEMSDADRAAFGRVSYRVYCRPCHGKGGQGDGTLAEILKVPPTDLTRLAVDGSFPSELVYEVIDGRAEIRGHGGRDMPIWGIAFQDPGRDSDQEEEVRERIRNLVAYVKSIQVEDGDEQAEEP